MQNPQKEICPLVSRLVSAPTPDVLRAEVERHFLPTAGFRHPLCLLDRGPRSRDALFGIYDWYRALSPGTTSKSRVLAWNEETGLIVLETVQQFHLNFSPFRTASARLVTNVTLERDEDTKLWYIAFQEDFYHPDHFMNLLLPPLARLIRVGLWAGTFSSGWLAPLGHVFGLFSSSPYTSVSYTPPDSSSVPVSESRESKVEVTLNLNPLHLVGRVLIAFDGLVRRRGIRYDPHDVVEPTPGEEEMILYGCRVQNAS